MDTRLNSAGLAAAAALLLLGAPAMALETPKYEVEQKYKDFEVRRYASMVVAETQVEGTQQTAGNQAFSRLGGYIFGNNEGAREIAMTAPVTQKADEGAKIAMTAPVTQTPSSTGDGTFVVQFMMPSQYTLDTLPQPKDSRVYLRQLPERTFAAVQYSGTWSLDNYREHLTKLQAGLKREGLVAKGEPVWARYNPPYTLWFLRTNEILVEVGPAAGG